MILVPMDRKDDRRGIYATPWDLFRIYDEEFRFDRDVCADPDNAKCSVFFGTEEDGLRQDWEGVCWCNPPYGQGKLKFWVRKAYEESRKGATVVCLIPARTNERWWHECVMKAAEVRFFQGGVKFEGMASALCCLPLCVVVFRPDCEGPPLIGTAKKNGRKGD